MGKILFFAGCLFAQSASALIINFDYSFDGGFFSGSNEHRRTTLEQAGDWLGTRLADPLSAVTYSSINFTNPSNESDSIELHDVTIEFSSILIYVGGRALDSSTLANGGPGGLNGSVPDIYRGQQAGVLSDTDFSPWGGYISFDNVGTSWFFDDDSSTDEVFSGFDFFSVALHEISHVLGYGTANSWNTNVSGSSFTGSNSVALFGGNVPLADNSHWQDGLQFNGESLALDPTITNGQRKRFSELDLAGLEDIGWELTSVPIPPALWLFCSAVGLLICQRRTKS